MGEEVNDLKHAAPFQNIIPKPFIPIKGKYHPSRTLYQNHLYPSKVNITLPEHHTKTIYTHQR
jgi:hypothetical protein